MTTSLGLALGASTLLGVVAFVVLPRSLRTGVDLLPSPLRALHMAVTAVPLVMGDSSRLSQHLRMAGCDDGPAGVRWARRRSWVYSSVLSALGMLASFALGCPPWLAPVVMTACGALGPGTLLAGLGREADLRRIRLRYELVDLLRALANMVAGGLSIRYSLEVVAHYRGALHAELADALRLLQSGVLLEEALDRFAQRCATDDVTEAVRALQGALGGRRTDNAALLVTMARSLETMLRQEAQVRRAQGMLRTQLAFGLLGLPPFLTAIAYPVGMMILQAVRGG
jgi:hypothetical protein